MMKKYFGITAAVVGVLTATTLMAQVDNSSSVPLHTGSETQAKQGTLAAVELVATDRVSADRYCDVDGQNCFSMQDVYAFMQRNSAASESAEQNTVYQNDSQPSFLSNLRNLFGRSRGDSERTNNSQTSSGACKLGSRIIQNGQSIRAYNEKEPNYASCISQTRTCNNGKLSGSNSFQYTSCKAQTDAAAGSGYCKLNSKVIPNGDSIKAYRLRTDGTRGCESETRRCINGNLTGSYALSSC